MPNRAAASHRAELVRILIVDDHPLVREGTALLISDVAGWEVCGFASSGDGLIEQALRLRPDVIVLDLSMPGFDGVEAVRELKKQLPSTELVIFSGGRAESVAGRLLEAGAKSFVGKSESSDVLKAAIESAAEHKTYLTPHVSDILLANYMSQSLGTPTHASQVTPREREIIRQIAQGQSTKAIAAVLGISARTAEAHRATIMRKLGASSVAEIVRYAIRSGIIEA